MANKRTVDPTASEASTKIVGFRMTATQMKQVAELCQKRGQTRSQLVRDLIRHAYDFEFCPEPF